MIRELINSELPQALEESAGPIDHPPPTGDGADFSVPVQVKFDSGVCVAQQHRGNSRDNVIVVDPAVVFQSRILDILTIADAGTAKSVNFFRFRVDRRDQAAGCADLGHGATERVSAKPERQIIDFQFLFEVGPEPVAFGLESPVHSSDRLGNCRQGVSVRLDIVPFVWLCPSADDDAVVRRLEPVGLSSIAVKELAFDKAEFAGRDVALLDRKVGNQCDFGQQQTPFQHRHVLQRPIGRGLEPELICIFVGEPFVGACYLSGGGSHRENGGNWGHRKRKEAACAS